LVLDAILGTGLGPRTPGGALTWIERLAAETQRTDTAMWVQGGPGALINALAQAAQAGGATLRVNARAEAMIARSGHVEGVVVAGGEALYAPVIVSSLAPHEVLSWPSLRRAAPPGAHHAAALGPPAHGLAKVHLALRGLPQFTGLDGKDIKARLVVAGSLDEVEQAFDDACSGVLPLESPMEILIPSAIDPSLAPKDGHVLSALIPFAPLSPAGGWREASNKLVLQTIAALGRYAPDLPNRILSAEAETPESMQHIAPASHALWRRPGLGPLHDANPYGCAIAGLYFCGAGTHPRLGASGLNGRNCAETILALEAQGLGSAP
jgi:phytoene dehydrogenase-like protein